MNGEQPTVYLLDDDAGVVKALTRLLAGHGWTTKAYTSADEFLQNHDADSPGCLILDLVMPKVFGTEVHRALRAQGSERPTIFISGCAEIPDCASAMKAGAFDFLTKPIDTPALIAAVSRALDHDAALRNERLRLHDRTARFNGLSRREREVIEGVVDGLRSREIATRLGIVEKTIKVHRANAMRKLGVRTVANLIRTMFSTH